MLRDARAYPRLHKSVTTFGYLRNVPDCVLKAKSTST